MRILVTAIGSRGDVQPVLSLARALREAGHAPIVSAPPDFAGWAAELGLPFEPAGATIEAILKENADAMGSNPVTLGRAIREILVQHTPGMLQQILDCADGVDAIVSAHQFLARTAAEILGLPLVGVMYQPTLVRSAHHPPMIARWQHGPRLLNRALWWAAEAMSSRIFVEPINRERKRHGLAPVASFERHVFHGVPYMLACDPVVAPAPPDWNDVDITTTGPWFYEDAAPLPGDVIEFLEAGPPPVYVGFGSMVSGDPARATRAILEGVAGRRVLLSKGWAGLGDGVESGSVKVVHEPMPHAKLFPRVAAVIHHGGSGTTATALRAGVPQVIVPHLMDQYYYGHRLEKLGLAPAAIPVRKLTAARLDRAIEAAIGLPPSAREEAAERLRPGEGLKRAVAFVEDRVGRERGVSRYAVNASLSSA